MNINLPGDADDLSKHAPALFALKGTETGFVVPALYFEELSELVIAKTAIPEEGGLVVPENYFEESAEQIVARTVLPGEDGLIVPENYFEELPSLIEARTAIPSESGLVVPENYFEALNENISAHLVLDNLKQDEGFVLPEQYFEKLTGEILNETSRVNLDSASTVLRTSAQDESSINDDQVPAGYFDTLHGKVVARIENETGEEKGRVIILSSWKKYTAVAAAASVVLVLGLVWLLSGTDENGNGSLRVASNTKNLVPDNYVRVVPQPENDTTNAIDVVVPEGIAIQTPKNPEGVKPPRNNEVIMNDDEIIAQSDLMDESLVMDFVAESNVMEPTEEVLDPAMLEYLMNDNSGLESFVPTDKK